MAEKKFGVRDLEIIDPTGTPTIESSGDLIVNAGGATERVRVTGIGSVGIGTDNPGYTLDVYNSAGTDCLRLNVNGSAGGSNKQNALRFSVDDDVKAHIGIAIDAGRLISGSIENDLCIKGHGSNNILFATNSSERLRITSIGRVGINTTIPDDTFEVYDGGILAPSRRTISSVVRYGTGIQYRDTSGNQRPILHIQAYSRGVGTGTIGSGSVYVNGVVVRTTGRAWGLTVISGGGSNLGQVLHSQTYDTYTSTSNVTSMVNDMATYDTNNNILIVNTYDEPNANANNIRTALKENYYAKHAESTSHRYAYVHAWRNGYGRLGECHSATRNGSTFTNQGNNSMANAGISFTVIL